MSIKTLPAAPAFVATFAVGDLVEHCAMGTGRITRGRVSAVATSGGCERVTIPGVTDFSNAFSAA